MNHDENWATDLRQVGDGVVPPTPADPHAMAATAVRRTRVRRAVIASGSVTGIIAMVAGTAFAMSGPLQSPEALPGGAVASTAEEQSASSEVSPASDGVPENWHTEQLRDLSYALPPHLVTSGPGEDEPGVESQNWHDRRDPDAPPFVRVEVVTPDHEFDYTDAVPLRSMLELADDGEAIGVEGAEVAVLKDATGDLMSAAGVPHGEGTVLTGEPLQVDGDSVRPVQIIIHPEGSDDHYVVSLNLPAEGSDELLDGFRDSLRLD